MTSAENIEEKLRSLLWRHRPEVLFSGGVRIVFTRNTSTLISLNRRGPSATLRVHRLFSNAPDAVLEAIVLGFFARHSRDRARKLRARIMDFVDVNRRQTIATTDLPRVLHPRGRHYDLAEVYSDVVRRYVPERRQRRDLLRVGWSERATPSLMGKWIETPADAPNLIVINPLLDDHRVPRYYLEYIVYHEVLHDLFPIRRRGGRWVQHPVEFRRRERVFPHFDAARRWEREELARLT
jgi:hypothetical protein